MSLISNVFWQSSGGWMIFLTKLGCTARCVATILKIISASDDDDDGYGEKVAANDDDDGGVVTAAAVGGVDNE